MKLYSATISLESLAALEPTPRYYARQRNLFVLLIIVVSVVPLVALSLMGAERYRRSWLEKTSLELRGLAEGRREVIRQFLANQEDLLSGLVHLYDRDFLGNQAKLEQVFAAINASGVIVDLGCIDAGGKHLAYVGPFKDQLVDKNYSDADWFRETMASGRFVSDVFLGYRNLPHFVVAVADPFKGWCLRATINSTLFHALLQGTEVGPGGDAFIVNRKGEMQTPRRGSGTGLSAVEQPLLTFHRDTEVRDIAGSLYATTWMKGGDWLLVLQTDIEDSLAPFHRERNLDWLLIAVAGGIIVAVAMFTVRRMVGRIERADRERTAANDEARQVEKMALVGRLAASVAHEINNPLQIIGEQAGWIGELAAEEEGERCAHAAEYREAAGKIGAHVKRASAITHRLLNFSRKMELTREPVDINTLVLETISFLEHEAESNRIAIRTELEKGLTEVLTDGSQLQQVFLNILNNALDAVGHDGAIEVRSRSVQGRVRVEFKDSGPGLAPEALANIFDPFYSTKAKGKGTGLGMSISYNIVQRLGGTIIAGNSPAGGALFVVELPAVSAMA